METYVYEVKLTVQVPAFSEDDAWEAIQDNFGVGEYGDVSVTDCEWEYKK